MINLRNVIYITKRKGKDKIWLVTKEEMQMINKLKTGTSVGKKDYFPIFKG